MITTDYSANDLYLYYQDYLKRKTNLVLLNESDFLTSLIYEKVVIVSQNESIDGFLSCCIVEDIAYISLVFGEELIKRKLIASLEVELLKRDVKEIWIHFFNPIKLAWYPKKDVIHPGVQGVVLDSELYNIYHDLGFINNSFQQTYYQDLKDFHFDDKLHKSNVYVDFYNPAKHYGLKEFANEIGVKSWCDEIINNSNLENPLPLIVALDNELVIGFTGPLKLEYNHRGYFAGIGLLEKYRGMGLGKQLFFILCQELKNIGAQYMTFFTGTNNPARFIYLSAGFEVVETFVTMKKRIKRG